MLSSINQSQNLLNHPEVKDKQELTELCIPGTSSVNLQTSQTCTLATKHAILICTSQLHY